MLNKKSQIKVLIIGKDGVARKNWVDYDAPFFDNKYKIDPDAVYQSLETSFLGLISNAVPTILFRENSVIAISHKVRATIPDPDEMGSSISRAAWAIAELMRKKNEQLLQIMMILMIVACGISAVSAFFAFTDGQKIDRLQSTVDALSARINSANIIQNGTINNPNNGMPIIPGGIITPSPTSPPIINQVPGV